MAKAQVVSAAPVVKVAAKADSAVPREDQKASARHHRQEHQKVATAPLPLKEDGPASAALPEDLEVQACSTWMKSMVAWMPTAMAQ